MEITQFEKYASFYDMLYQHKDYKGEAAYIEEIINQFVNKNREHTQVLDLACGTGKHIFELYQQGYQVTGSDISTQMIEVAREKALLNNFEISFYNHSFQEADKIEGNYDCVISMFSAVDYLTNYRDQVKAFTNIYNLLADDGVFIFDFWNGNTVVKEYSPVKVLRKSNGDQEIMRISETKINTLNQDVWVKFTCFLFENNLKSLEFTETHHLHYYYLPEIENLLTQCGFTIEHKCPFLKLQENITDADWNISIVARKNKK
ncbi:class I SAM-dependent DNA methyltransferase [Adhaeribacter rhizoryzae]|uniref:Class I SAM-dependent methyltransferase n=1 Tax=Adhaeribacter rhizoryzae TaxID=2607907 RepID=A0A5M6DB30_9BACT|nr:class I SAM-dependent methyltransferase [Adhaeribacter rhizoryzae]KAA5544751.1 class I SAM-dependent methyltransferase [Adhaeribacter rhizoryzae]